METLPSKTCWLYVLVLSFVCLALYGNALGNEFVYDDQDQVLRNPALHSDQAWTQFFTQDVWGFRKARPVGPSNYYRPLQFLAYRLQYSLFGLDPRVFHGVNLGFHVLATLAVYALLAQLLSHRAAAFLGAVLFAAHPIHTEAVAWVSALPELLCGLFYFLAVSLFIRAEEARARRAVYFALSLLAAFLALLAKEMAFTLPFVLLLYFSLRSRSPLAKQRLVFTLGSYAIVFLLYLALRLHALGALTHIQHQIRLTPGQFFLSAVTLVGKYLWKLLLPLNLNAFHVFDPARSLSDWKFLVAALALAGLTWAFFHWRRQDIPTAFLLAWTVLTLLPALYIGGVGENVFAERYLYIPSLGFCGLLGMALAAAWKQPSRFVWPAAAAAVVFLFAFYSSQTIRRNPDWRNNFILYADTVKKSPTAAFMHNALAEEYLNRGNIEEALAHYQEALRVRQGAFYAGTSTAYYAVLGIANIESQRGRFSEAEKLIREAIDFAPEHPEAYNNYGRLLIQQGRREEGIRYLERAIEVGPDDEVYQFNLGVALLDRGEYERACQRLERSLEIYPQDPDAWRLLGVARLRRRLFAEAEAAFQQALNLNPDQKGVHRYLGALYYDTSRYAEAAHAFRRAVELAPDDADAAHWLKLAEEKIAHK